MDIRVIKTTAARQITPQVRTLAGRFVLVQAALILVVNLINFLIEKQLDSATGLSGIATRQIWEMVRTIVLMAGSLALPFWTFGILRLGMAAARGEQPDKAMLLAGFHRFFPLLRLTLLRLAVFSALSMMASYGSTMLYMLSPASAKVMTQMEALLAQGEAALTVEAMEGLMAQMWPMYLLMGIATAVLVIPAFYRLRLADYVVLDGQDRALAAMRESRYRSYTHKLQLVKLDLSFWWYYLLMGVALVISYADLLLPQLGVKADPDTAYWICMLVSIALQGAVGYFALPKLHTAYALFYDALAPTPQ